MKGLKWEEVRDELKELGSQDILCLGLILQWNARSLLTNGQDSKKCIDSRKERPDVIQYVCKRHG